MSRPATKDHIEPADVLIGQRIRLRRNILGMTQSALAEQLGVSFQQIQKYETGKNKVYASKLYHIAQILKMPLTDFFEEEKPRKKGMSDQKQAAFSSANPLLEPETPLLLRAYYEIKDKKKRKMAIDLMKNLNS
ncbi:MAG: transcriptional regulator [Micavibrio aeruginosavorus]|uniref:Transcriptional regulator n=1 Tax=Micavibrio aeruginosavorus TaxID=349221 RepID=A0A2W5FK90_9BACT|nr:MAG: transcriptional regulator [Micavibrio aeruginosavorus]